MANLSWIFVQSLLIDPFIAVDVILGESESGFARNCIEYLTLILLM